MSWKGPPVYDITNNSKKLIHTTRNSIIYKWCGGKACFDKETNHGIWKQLNEFNKCLSRWDDLETICKNCKAYARCATSRNRKMCTACNKWGDLVDFQEDTCSACTQKPTEPEKEKRTVYIIQDNKEGRICKGCNVWMSIEGDNFKIKGHYKDGRKQYETRCKECSKAYKQALPDLMKQAEEEKNANTGMQKCNKCNNWKDFAEYSKNKLKTNGFESTCKICLSKDGKMSNMLGKPARVEHTLVDGKLGKKCKICETWKSFDDNNFKSKGTYDDGEKQYDSYCKECYNKKECNKRKEKLEEKTVLQQQDPNYGKKQCKRCEIWKEPSKFRKDKRGKYGVGTTCCICISKYPEPNRKLGSNLRNRIYGALKGNKKSDHSIQLVGCTVEQLWVHLESQFQENMNRENYGKWHVDHIKPCSLFNLTDPREQRRCFNYQNLQPLWAEDNLTKNNKYRWNVVLEIALWNIK